jgi:hypothetical protein
MAKRRPDPPPIELRQFTLPDIEKGVAKLKRRIDDVKALNPEQIPTTTLG